jgi:hypothetical protein
MGFDPGRARPAPDWAVTATNYFVGNATVTIEGPEADVDTGQGVVYATVTCYGNDGSEALARSRATDASTGSATTDLDGIGDEGYAIEDGSGLSASTFDVATWCRTSWSPATSHPTSSAQRQRPSIRR